MPPAPTPSDDFELFKGSLLPSNVRPLVLIAWQTFAGNNLDSEFRVVQIFIIVPGSEVVAREIGISTGDLESMGIANALPTEAVRKFALGRAQKHLDGLAAEQFDQNHAPRTFYQPLILESVAAEAALSYGLAEEYHHAWDFIQNRTHGEKLRSFTTKLLKLGRSGISLQEARPLTGRLR